MFEFEVHFFSQTDRYNDTYYNTIVPLYDNVRDHINLIKKITYIERGFDSETNDIIEDERYFSSDDQAYTSHTTSDDRSDDESEEEEGEEDESEEDESEEEEEEEKKSSGSCCTWYKIYFFLTIVILIFMNYRVDDDYVKIINDFNKNE